MSKRSCNFNLGIEAVYLFEKYKMGLESSDGARRTMSAMVEEAIDRFPQDTPIEELVGKTVKFPKDVKRKQYCYTIDNRVMIKFLHYTKEIQARDGKRRNVSDMVMEAILQYMRKYPQKDY